LEVPCEMSALAGACGANRLNGTFVLMAKSSFTQESQLSILVPRITIVYSFG